MATVYAVSFGYSDCDALGTVIGTDPEKVDRAMRRAIREEARDVRKSADPDFDTRTISQIIDTIWTADGYHNSDEIGISSDILEEIRTDGYVWV